VGNLKDELEFTLEILIKSGFFNNKEILEIIEEQFINEDINFDDLEISPSKNNNENFKKLEEAFIDLNKKNILAIHNCGYDLEEGVTDSLELFYHLKNNDLHPEGMCFYSFEDIEEAILEGSLFLTFADFNDNKDSALEIGKTIVNTLKGHGFNINWAESIDEFIEITNFIWDKSFTEKSYDIEEAFELFKNLHQ